MIVIEEQNGVLILRKASLSDICEAVYAVTMTIPPGRVSTYSSIARVLGVSPRIVAYCLSKNKELIKIPCHRVVYSNRGLGGFSNGGPLLKKRLLELEGVRVKDNRVEKEFIVDVGGMILE
ncbi:MAG: MGMT family protein [Desulfurococcus sp.]|nr:MGMT family protein [Desulfurococcus sp.]